MLKPFREYTVPQNEEGKFKGWSKRAARDMAATCKKIKEGKEEYLKFRMAYREIYASRRQHKRKNNNPIAQDIEVDYSELWDVEDINLTEF